MGGSDPVLGVEMASTGEVTCFGKDKHEAFLKAILASTIPLPSKRILLMSGDDKEGFDEAAQRLNDMGYEVYATPGTAAHLREKHIPVQEAAMPTSTDEVGTDYGTDALSMIRRGEIDMVFAFPRDNRGKKTKAADLATLCVGLLWTIAFPLSPTPRLLPCSWRVCTRHNTCPARATRTTVLTPCEKCLG